jgi:AraC-like DNA-binding protein
MNDRANGEPTLINGSSKVFDFEKRPSDSPFVDLIWRTRAECAGSFISVAASHWEMVVTKYGGRTTLTVRGPETTATPTDCQWTGAEFFGIIFKLGAFMPHLPPGSVMDLRDANLPEATSQSFWLHGSAWQYPDYENADTFVDRLVRGSLLARAPIVEAALQGHLKDMTSRTAQRHFLHATGLTHTTIRQIERARHATILLQEGASILDTVFEAGYFDQPHLTRSLKHLVGQTPSQIMDKSRSEQMSFLYKTLSPLPCYDTPVDDRLEKELV